MNLSKLLSFLVLFNVSILVAQQKYAFCAAPIADCSCHPLTVLFEDQDGVDERYAHLPLSGQTGRHACPRDQQLLAHEIVTLGDSVGDECEVIVPNIFYIDPDFPLYKKYNFWTLKKNLIVFDELQQQNINPHNYLPKPLEAHKTLVYDSSVATLILPFHDQVTNQLYSVGTRFLIVDETENGYGVWVFDPHDQQFKHTTIERTLCARNSEKSHQERLHDFVNLLKVWANNQNGFIPFVWGGSSAREFFKHDEFHEEYNFDDGQPVSYWVRDACTTHPHAGFDASSLVLRAAQIVGIPYFCKNTKTAHKFLQQLNNQESLQEGDLLWLPSGVMVVSDLKNNKVIAARGYQTGYGKVVECALSECFKNIQTYDELVAAYKNKTPLECCSKDGIVTKLYDDWTLLKLMNN